MENNIKSYTDTSNFKNNLFFLEFPNAIRIDLYYDDIEIVNPLGSKKGLNKLGVFYFKIQNFPPMFNSCLQNIYILLICYSWDIKRYGFKKILGQLINDLKKLEIGINIKLPNGNNYHLKACVVNFCGDCLAAHEILGLLSPSCTHFCRSCMITRSHLHEYGGLRLYSITKRNKTLHEEQLRQILENPMQAKNFGMKEDSVLNSLQLFHSTSDAPFDAMHDFLEGVVPFSISMVLKFCIQNKYFSIDVLNHRIAIFRYGPMEYKNKPSPCFDQSHFVPKRKSIPQNAVQTWLLLRALPFLIGYYIPNHQSNYMTLIILLIKIVEIIFSPTINNHMLCELDYYIKTHEKLLLFLFPHIKLINKHHYIHHYVKMIKEKGPPIHYCCLWFESKHSDIKNQARVSQNYINLPYTILKKKAFKQSQEISNQKFELKKFEIISKKSITVHMCKSETYLRGIYTADELSNIHHIKVLKINNVVLQNNYFLPFNEDFPSFIKVEEILSINSNYYLYGFTFKTECFHEHLNSYEISQEYDTIFINLKEFSFFKPVSIWHTFENTEINYISRKEYY